MWNIIQRSQLRLGPWNWLGLRWGKKIMKRNASFESHLGHLICIGQWTLCSRPKRILDVKWYSAIATPARLVEFAWPWMCWSMNSVFMSQRNSRCEMIFSDRSSVYARGIDSTLDEAKRSGTGTPLFQATSFILFVSVNELCVHVPQELSMWNIIQRSQLRPGLWNWLGLRWGEKIR